MIIQLCVTPALYVSRKNAQFFSIRNSQMPKSIYIRREFGYNYLKLKERYETTPATKSSPSFAHLWNSQASYFSGVLLINGDLLREKVCTFFQADTCDPARLAAIIDFFQVTPEMLFHRLTEILPRFFNIEHVHFLRFDCEKEPRERFLLTKYLNMASLPISSTTSSVNIIVGAGWRSKSCGRLPRPRPSGALTPIIRAGRSRFPQQSEEWLCFSAARLGFLGRQRLTSITIGFKVDEAVKKAVRFWDDRTNIETREVGYTCERCFLLGCNELAVEPAIDRGDVDSTQQTADMAALATAVRTRRAQQQDATPRRPPKGAVRPPAARQPAATAGAKRALGRGRAHRA